MNPPLICPAIRPCDKDNPNAIRWGALKEDGRWLVLPKSCRGIAEPLYSIMGWDGDCGYRVKGRYFEEEGERAMLFEMDEPELLMRAKEEKEISEGAAPNEKEDASNNPDTKPALKKGKIIYMTAPSLKDRYGEDAGGPHLLKRIEYGGNWEILRPADPVEGIQEFNADQVKEFEEKAQELIDRMRCGKQERENV